VPPRIFTVEQARALLPDVRRYTEELVSARASQLAASARIAELNAAAGGNGHGPDAVALDALRDELEQAETALAAALAMLGELGVVVKDVDAGLVDFPARRDEADVFLCWKLGEDDIAWWHGVEDGFRGRRPL
jgi:hypothetical protein